jgi:hypothetical protein
MSSPETAASAQHHEEVTISCVSIYSEDSWLGALVNFFPRDPTNGEPSSRSSLLHCHPADFEYASNEVRNAWQILDLRREGVAMTEADDTVCDLTTI